MEERGYAKGRAKREEILDSAVAVFGEIGYRSASLREIAGRCGISHAGLLHHFHTKEALLLAVLQRRDEREAAHAPAEGGGVDELRRTLDGVSQTATQRGIVELFTTLSAEATAPDHPAHAYFADRYRNVVAHLARAYRLAGAEGALRPGVDPVTAARELVALLDGLQVQWLYDPEGVDMVALVREHLSRRLAIPVPPPAG